MATQRIIGIDFATSTTVIRVKTYINGVPENSPVFVEFIKFDNDDTLPTLALWDDDYGYVFGKEANDLSGNSQGELIRNFKMNLLSSDAEVHEKTRELISKFFRYIYEEGYALQKDHFTPCDEEITYISYPAKWSREIANIMIQLVSDAGFRNVKGLDEASAAIHTVLVQKKEELKNLGNREMHILMVDMGAGTTDLALCRYIQDEKNVEIISTYPHETDRVLFGGREFDDALWRYIREHLADCDLNFIISTLSRPFFKLNAWTLSRAVSKCGW